MVTFDEQKAEALARDNKESARHGEGEVGSSSIYPARAAFMKISSCR